jgi:hypothetical protein
MRIRIFSLVALCLWLTACFVGGGDSIVAGVTGYAEDTFAQPDGPLSSNWMPLPRFSALQPSAPPPVVKNEGWTIDPSFYYGAAIYQGTFANNQWAAARIQALSPTGTDVQLGLCIRCSVINGFFNGYYLLIGPNNLENGRAATVEIWEAYNGEATPLAIPYANQTTPLSLGDTIMFMAVRNQLTIEMYEPHYSTTTLISQTVINNDIGSGSPGIVAQTAQPSNASQGTQFGQFAAGSFIPDVSVPLPLFSAMDPVAHDTFARPNGDLVAGDPNWTYSLASSSPGGLQILGELLAPTSRPDFSRTVAYYSGATFSPNQYVQATVRSGTRGVQHGTVALRASSTSLGYTLSMGTSGSFRLATASLVTLASFAASNAGDVWLLEMKGIAIFVLQNGTLQYICTDDTIPGGTPGVGGVIGPGQTATGDLFNWRAGNIE